VVNTIVTRHTQTHRADFSRYFTAARIQHHPFGAAHGPTLYHVGPNMARLHQLATVSNGLDIQATVYSYVDDLRYLGIVCLVCLPIVFMVQSVKAKKGAPAGAH